ncbi:MAG TPA: ribosome small subunit-dependent GTPase A [Bacteroidia bacterium]|nr:ribosome small subunit-dependent GTPase A [Bacteroidia bacterium]
MRAVVTKSTGSWYDVKDETGKVWQARIKGKLRLKGLKSTNPVAVGDFVEIEPEGTTGLALISDIAERKNYIIRKSNNLSKQTQVIAANLDQAVLFVTLARPRTSLGFIDRFLVTAEAYHIPVILAFNKIDIYDEVDTAILMEYSSIYESIGYDCIQVSAKMGTNISALKEKLEGKTTLVSGHSGSGKSTFLNSISPEIQQKTAEISDYSLKGKHTTTFAEMFEIEGRTRIIDTPGIKDFGVVDLEQVEISHYFREMKPLIGQCRFNNCIHVNEPGCAILRAVESGAIRPERYYSYLGILNNEDAHH